MRRGAVWAVVVFLSVVLQLTIVDRLRLPGRSGPDLVLVLVVALGLAQGPAAGALVGFSAGLGLDLAPPATHPIGETALALCVVGYGCGWLSGRLTSGAGRLLAALIGTAMGVILQAAAGLIARDPGVTLSAARHVLPVALLYDVLFIPVALLLVAAASRPRGARRPGGTAAAPPRLAGSGSAALRGRPGGPRSSPVRLRLGASHGIRTAAPVRARRGRSRRVGVSRWPR